ncbi:MAG: hypothetical protein JWQ88_2523 [Rhodoferax sp.]|nr:hypothetical protein [Rhodoferax sp.]
MTPQSHFMVVARVGPGQEPGLRLLLNAMNREPGMADPANEIVPFGRFERLHFARLVLLDDALQADLQAYGRPAPNLPLYLAFMGDCDGPGPALLAEIAAVAHEGLRRIFRHCEDFDPDADLLDWLQRHDRPLAALYVHWVGRTVVQVREEEALRQAVAAVVPRTALRSLGEAEAVRQAMRRFVDAEVAAGRLRLTPAAPTPAGWRMRQCLHLVGVPLAALALLPFLLALAPFIAWQLRRLERTDPEIAPRPEPDALQALQALEDEDVSNQYTALGPVKPGVFRRWLLTGLLVAIAYACRHVFTRGHLGRVQTIHFARWAFLNGKTRVVFTSNYDGSHQSYMDDFINKVAWGLNLVFSNGIGWPRTRWLLFGGARHEQAFKYYQRRHQVPTQVWYKAYPGLTLADLGRNQRIREGLERPRMTDAEALAWLALP